MLSPLRLPFRHIGAATCILRLLLRAAKMDFTPRTGLKRLERVLVLGLEISKDCQLTRPGGGQLSGQTFRPGAFASHRRCPRSRLTCDLTSCPESMAAAQAGFLQSFCALPAPVRSPSLGP